MHQKAQNVPSFPAFPYAWNTPLLSYRGTSSTFPFFQKAENPSVRQSAPSATTASPVMCCQYFNKGLLETRSPESVTQPTSPGWGCSQTGGVRDWRTLFICFSHFNKTLSHIQGKRQEHLANAFLLRASYQQLSCLGPGKEKNNSTLLRVSQSVHLEKIQGMEMVGRDLNPFQGLLRTVSVSSKLGKGPQLQSRKSCQILLSARC